MLVLSIMGLLAFASATTCEAARAQYEDLAFEAALKTVEGARSDPVCLEVRALVLLAMDRRTDARSTLLALFEKHPNHPVDLRALAPSDRTFIERVRAARRPMAVESVAEWLVHSTLRLQFIVQGGLRRARRIEYRATIGAHVHVQTVSLAGRVGATTMSVPPLPVDAMPTTEGPVLKLAGRVLDAQNRALHTFASEQRLATRPQLEVVERTESFIPWWVWAVGAAVVVSGTVTAVVLAQPGTPDVTGTLGGRRVP